MIACDCTYLILDILDIYFLVRVCLCPWRYIYGTLLAGTHQAAQMSWLLNFLLLCIPQRLLVHFLDQYRFDQNHPMDSKDHFDGDSSPWKSKGNLMWNWPNPPGTSLDTSYLSPDKIKVIIGFPFTKNNKLSTHCYRVVANPQPLIIS